MFLCHILGSYVTLTPGTTCSLHAGPETCLLHYLSECTSLSLFPHLTELV